MDIEESSSTRGSFDRIQILNTCRRGDGGIVASPAGARRAIAPGMALGGDVGGPGAVPKGEVRPRRDQRGEVGDRFRKFGKGDILYSIVASNINSTEIVDIMYALESFIHENV